MNLTAATARRVLMASFLYYRHDLSVMSDDDFDRACRFLARRSDLFEVDTAGALGRRLRDGLEPARAAGPIEWPPGKRRYRALRFVEQAVKRLEARAPFSFATLGRP